MGTHNTNPTLTATSKTGQSGSSIGIALGGGAARGWAHIGVLQALAAAGIKPDLVVGTSIGALVGAAYAAGTLDELERWVRTLQWKSIVGFFDIDLRLRGGLIEGKKLFNFLSQHFPYQKTEELPIPFAAVATDLETGREIWLQQGALLESVRASAALPGLFPPVYYQRHWLVDGGLVNPVPVTVCRALGATQVIAVDLNAELRVRHRLASQRQRPAIPLPLGPVSALTQALWTSFWGDSTTQTEDPGINTHLSLFDVVASSINIMQVRITRSRLAGDPPDVLITPHLNTINLMDFHRAKEAIVEGRAAVARVQAELVGFK